MDDHERQDIGGLRAKVSGPFSNVTITDLEAATVTVTKPRILIPTSRDFYRLVSYGTVIDFEDAFSRHADVDLVSVPYYTRRAHLKASVTGDRRFRPVQAPRDAYDLCVLVAMDPTWIPALRLVSEIREYCAHVCVYVFDSWTRFLPRLERDRSLWKLCDLALVSFESSRAAYARTLPCEVAYLPQGVDSSKFHPDRLDRPIDLLSIGRRHSVAHGLLLELARRHDLFYFFSESKAPQAIDVRQSQELLGRICQAARTQISWAVELTDPSRAGTDAPVTVRWFEAAACASVVLGSQPTAPEFERLFPLPTFVKELPLDDPKQFEKTVLASLGDARSPDRLALAAQTRRHHSWDARTQDVLRYFNLEATS